MTMKIEEIMSKVDHTLLLQTATEAQIKQICDEAVKYNTASVCIPPCYVKIAKEYLGGKISVCTVIGFPNGYNSTAVKCAETIQALNDGADEIDMVVNITDIKNERFDLIGDEIRQIKDICKDKILKVIIETCLLSNEEKIRMCSVVTESGADYIKTSTGFSTAGATFDDIELFARYVGENIKIKAAGGIKSFEDAERFIELGASRLGTSRLVAILNNQNSEVKY